MDSFILRVNLNERKAEREKVPEKYFNLGGRALTSAIIVAEVDPLCDPLGGDNKLVFAPGLLSGISASSVHRLSAGGKSPLTGGIKESNAGGNFAMKMARMGIKALILEGVLPPGEKALIDISEEGRITFIDASPYWGLDTLASGEKITAQLGGRRALAVIGPGGEQGMLTASIVVTDRDGVVSRHLGRGGLGAVLGGMGIKGLAIDDSSGGRVTPRDPSKLKETVREYTRLLRETPQTSEIYTKYGTTAMVDIVNPLGAMPTRNFSCGQFEQAEKINGVSLYQRIVERGGDPSHGCMPGCLIRSSNIYPDAEGRELVRSLEYETIVLCGSNLGIADLDAIAEFNLEINKLGLDSIDCGAAMGLCMEAGLYSFGDIDGVRAMLQEVAANTPLGRMLGAGAALTGRILGVKRIPAAKGQAFPGYDPRSVKGHGVTFATSPMGADHTAGMNIREKQDPHSKEGQVESSRHVQQLAMIYDSLGICLFAHVAVRNRLDVVLSLIEAVHGLQWSPDDIFAWARESLELEVSFNRAAGLGPATDRLPEIFYEEKLAPAGTTFDLEAAELKPFDASIQPE